MNISGTDDTAVDRPCSTADENLRNDYDEYKCEILSIKKENVCDTGISRKKATQSNHPRKDHNYETRSTFDTYIKTEAVSAEVTSHTRMCPICSKSFAPKYLTEHIARVHKKEKHKCKSCPKAYYSKKDLERHENMHIGESPFTCMICHKGFISKRGYSIHKFQHTGERPHKCGICSKSFIKPWNLQYHHRTVHTNDHQKLQCEECGKYYMSNFSLKKHQEAKHLGLKPFQCQYCKANFKYKKSLVVHELNHQGIKSFQCTICGKRFVDTAGLNRHERTHRGDKPFSCFRCTKSFTQKHTLKKHLERHSRKMVTLASHH